MSLQCTGLSLVSFSPSKYAKENVLKAPFSFQKLSITNIRSPLLAGRLRTSLRASNVEVLDVNDDENKKVKNSNENDRIDDDDDDDDSDFEMDEDERKEFRKKIRQMIEMNPEVEAEVDPEEKRKKMQKLLADYPLVVDEDDPDWPEDADGWGFNFSQFFDKMSVKNVKKDNDDDDGYDSETEVNWQDIRAIKDITSSEWEETVFSDLSPLVVLVHNRYRRPKENEMVRDHLEKAIQLIWDCRIPSPRCVAIDAVVECDLVSTLGVSVFPELIFTKTGKILHREKETRTADELSKIMAFFYYGGAKPPCLKTSVTMNDAIPGYTAKK